MEQLFLDLVSSPLDANFLVKDGEVYGFENLTVEPLTFSKEAEAEYYQKLRSIKEELENFNYQKLDPARKLTYRVVLDYLELSLSFEDYYYYNKPLGSYLGYQAQLPLVLSEYHFYTKRDLENYFDYLKTTQTTFENIIAYEKEKAANGFGMNDREIDGIIKQCEDFLAAEENYLITIFNKKIEDLPFLSIDEKNLYRKENQNLVMNKFLPAYSYLTKELKKLKGKAVNKQGLAHFEKGKDYYQILFRDATGSKMKVSEAYEYLDNKFKAGFKSLLELLRKEPDIYDRVETLEVFLNKSYQETFNFYLENYADDFPKIGNVQVRIENIHASLEENSAPAMYFLSPIDAEVTEVIYVNKNLFRERPTYAFFTLAHEGIPGHLLQHSILKNSSLPKIRKLIGYSAYSEGWATYVETYVGKYTEVESNLLLAYHLNDELSYTYLCLADIGINYYGWSFPKFKEFINQLYNFSDKEAEDIYYQLIEVATNYLEYYFGYYKLLDLKAKFMEASKNLNLKNSDYEFHKFYLETGPAPFYILEEELEIYLNQFKPNRKVRFFNENCPHSPNISTEVVL
ncbi:MAG TPA: DUF885 domain-containing protein [Acholeplasmataceae bacterium]|nr:DUF885 domain-containing protein [Acholeplasmataceae bacterium]